MPWQEYSTTKSKSLTATLEVRTVDPGTERASALRQEDSKLGRVVENRVITKGGPVKRHIGGVSVRNPTFSTDRIVVQSSNFPKASLREVCMLFFALVWN
jgi:hypothetical protein